MFFLSVPKIFSGTCLTFIITGVARLIQAWSWIFSLRGIEMEKVGRSPRLAPFRIRLPRYIDILLNRQSNNTTLRVKSWIKLAEDYIMLFVYKRARRTKDDVQKLLFI